MSAPFEIEDVKRITLHPGDTLVAKVAMNLSQEQANRIRHELKAIFPDHQVLITTPDVDLEIVERGGQ